jgi:N-acetylmuramic acid 6-phosphate etherase
MISVTEQESNHHNLEQLSTAALLQGINAEDSIVPTAVNKALPQIEALVNAVVERLQAGGRLFYIGAGTSGRLGIVDASECPPTFGVPFDLVIGIIAGGDGAIRKAVEFAEDNERQAIIDMQGYGITGADVVIGIAASGRTPYVIGGLLEAKDLGCVTGCVVCNLESPIGTLVDFPVEVVVGPEFVTGSTRLKAGTAQKLVLNMITTATMIKLGKVKGNKMVDMQLTNYKLVDRGNKMVREEIGVSEEEAAALLSEFGGVRKAVEGWQNRNNSK